LGGFAEGYPSAPFESVLRPRYIPEHMFVSVLQIA